jgi:hypothetical protein
MAQLNSHYDSSRWLADMGEALEQYTVDQMILTLDVAGRRFRLDPAAALKIEHLGQIAAYLQDEETQAGMGKIVAVAERVKAIYDLAFPRADAAEPEVVDAGQEVQPV